MTDGERWLFKSLLGYADTKPSIRRGGEELKRPDSAPLYVFESLWPDGKVETDKRATPFPLHNLIPSDGLPSMFVHTLESLKQMFRDGREMNALSQTSFLRTIQHFQKIYTPDMAIKPGGYLRLWISGPVRTDV